MKLISKKYFLLVILIISLPGIFAQENYKEHFSSNNLNPNLQENLLRLKGISLTNHFTEFINPQKPNVQDNLTIIDSIITYGTTGSKGKRTYTYDENGRIKSYLILYLYNNEWLNSSKITYTYDASGNLLNILHQYWQNGSYWENDLIENYTYNDNENIVLKIVKLWLDNNWKNMLRISKKYDSTGNMITSVTEQWNNNVWINSSKITLNYYPNGKRDFNLAELWNGSNWENIILLTFKYINDWELLSLLYKNWDGDSWKNNNQTTFTYSLDESQLIGLNEVWDNNQWIVHSRYSNSYNAKGYFTHGIYELWESGNWVPYDGGILIIENPDGFVEFLWTYEAFVYYGKPTSVEAEGNFPLKDFILFQNYPNPFNPSTIISWQSPVSSWQTLKIYDVLGNEVATLVDEYRPAGSYEVEFSAKGGSASGGDAYSLASGIYIYRLTAGNPSTGSGQSFTASKKLILLK